MHLFYPLQYNEAAIISTHWVYEQLQGSTDNCLFLSKASWMTRNSSTYFRDENIRFLKRFSVTCWGKKYLFVGNYNTKQI